MQKVSIIIVHRNDEFLYFTVNSLLKGIDSSRLEIIIYDDCSDEPLTINQSLYPNVRVINGTVQRGVGYGFDRGVEQASNEYLILTASDVIVKNPDYLDRCIEYLNEHPRSIGCSCCLEGSPDYLDPYNPMPTNVNRYGANLLIYSTGEELPFDSPLREGNSYYIGCFDSKWIKRVPEQPVSEVAVVYGAFYTTTKSWYNHIRGWDTKPSFKFSGHQRWGHLEPYISIKSWLAGGSCHAIRDLETLHVFHKFRDKEDDITISSNNRGDLAWYNAWLIAFTMMEYNDAIKLQNKVIEMLKVYELHIKNPTEGRRLIRYYLEYVLALRELNVSLFSRDIDWLCDKFKISKDWR